MARPPRPGKGTSDPQENAYLVDFVTLQLKTPGDAAPGSLARPRFGTKLLEIRPSKAPMRITAASSAATSGFDHIAEVRGESAVAIRHL